MPDVTGVLLDALMARLWQRVLHDPRFWVLVAGAVLVVLSLILLRITK